MNDNVYMQIDEVPMDLKMWDDFCSMVPCMKPSAQTQLYELKKMIEKYHNRKRAYDLLFEGEYNRDGCRILIDLWDKIMLKGKSLFRLMDCSIQDCGDGTYYIYGVGSVQWGTFRSESEQRPRKRRT
jgi:hypothetical protein